MDTYGLDDSLQISAALSRSTFRSRVERDLLKREQDEAEEEKHIGEEQQRAKAEKRKVDAAVEPSPGDAKKLKSALHTLAIEKSAKLDAHLVRLRTDLENEEPRWDHYSAEEKTTYVGELKVHRTKVQREYTGFAKMVQEWQLEHTFEKLVKQLAEKDPDTGPKEITDDVNETYKVREPL